ncbi:MAG: hypothetical protein F4059_01655 [Gemmatimonadetes bacterium]|nr:hypothetical protein [Gemmatimonadota bacterium]
MAKAMLAVCCMVLCAACRDEPPDPGATGRPAAPDLFSAWPGDESFRVAAEPSLVVGADESLPLGRVTGAVFFGEGIAIADAQAYEVLVLDRAGRLLYRQGGQGEGPGEYMYLNGIARHGDGLVTSDTYHLRLTRLDASGRYVEQAKHGWYTYHMSRIVGGFGSSALVETWAPGWPGSSPAGPMEVRQPVTYEMVRLSNGEVVFEGTRPGQEQWALREVRDDGNLSEGWESVVFGRTAVSATTDRYAYLADTDSITITRYDEAGTAVEVVLFEQPRESAQAEWVRLVIDTRRANEFISEFDLRLLEDLPARATLPAFSAMKGGTDGLLWIREYPDPLQDQVVWVGFTEAWERKMRITVPVDMAVLDIAEDRVLVQAKGALDEELVEVYPLVR